MTLWTSVCLVAVVVVNWLCGQAAADDKGFCAYPENLQLCELFGDTYGIMGKRGFLRWGRNLGDNFLRFGRNGVFPRGFRKRGGGGDSYDDMHFLRFGRSVSDASEPVALVYPPIQRRRRSAQEDLKVDNSPSEGAKRVKRASDGLKYLRFGRADENKMEEKKDMEMNDKRIAGFAARDAPFLRFGKRPEE